MKLLIFLLIILFNSSLYSFPIPKDNKASFDILRKNKVIGSVVSTFTKENESVVINTILDIKIKIFLIPAYKFFQKTEEKWINGEFISITGYTDFEDDREYYIKGNDSDINFIASGMDGEIILDKNILPLNYWNKKILNETKLFDTQKGIVREIKVNRLEDEIIKIKNNKIMSEKYTLDASTNPKDKGPFPTYTLWYDKNEELIKFEFLNWKDNKYITTLRNDWVKN